MLTKCLLLSSQGNLYAHLFISTQMCQKWFRYLHCRVDTATDVCVLPLGVYMKIFHDISLEKLGLIQEPQKVCTSVSMMVIRTYVLYVHDVKQPEMCAVDITDIDISVFHSCEDSLEIWLGDTETQP